MAKLEKPKPSEMCPPGYHVVRGHTKNARNTLKAYNQWNKKGDAYAEEVLSSYNF